MKMTSAFPLLFFVCLFVSTQCGSHSRSENTKTLKKMWGGESTHNLLASGRAAVWSDLHTSQQKFRKTPSCVLAAQRVKQSKLTNCRSTGCNYSEQGMPPLCENELFILFFSRIQHISYSFPGKNFGWKKEVPSKTHQHGRKGNKHSAFKACINDSLTALEHRDKTTALRDIWSTLWCSLKVIFKKRQNYDR